MKNTVSLALSTELCCTFPVYWSPKSHYLELCQAYYLAACVFFAGKICLCSNKWHSEQLSSMCCSSDIVSTLILNISNKKWPVDCAAELTFSATVCMTSYVLNKKLPFFCRGNVVTMECVEKIIKKDMVDPTNSKKMTDKDIIPLQRVCNQALKTQHHFYCLSNPLDTGQAI